MRCDVAREAVSARLDGERAGISEHVLADHLSNCQGCREWERNAMVVSRQARISSAPELGDLADRVLAEVRAGHGARRREWFGVRASLCLVAALQLAVTIPVLVMGHDREAPLHVSHEMGSWDAALGLALLAAAWRPSRAAGMSILIGLGAALLCVTAFIDLAAGRTSVLDEIPHLLAVAGWLLLHRLQVLDHVRRPRDPARAVGSSTATERSESIHGLSA